MTLHFRCTIFGFTLKKKTATVSDSDIVHCATIQAIPQCLSFLEFTDTRCRMYNNTTWGNQKIRMTKPKLLV